MSELEEPKAVEVSEPVIKKGNVRFLSPQGFNNPAPEKLKIVIKSLQGFAVGLITMVSATDIFPAPKVKIITFALGAFALLCEAILKATGVESVADTKKRMQEEK